MTVPQSLSTQAIQKAHRRLRGQLVATPLIGELRLPEFQAPPTLRVKAENLQTGGSLYFRGAMHFLLRQLGALKGLVAHGDARVVLAAATAASLHRLPCVVFPDGEPDQGVWQLLRLSGCEVRPRSGADAARSAAQEAARELGYRVMPGVEDELFAAGIATLGVELADELAGDCELVVVAPLELAGCVALGLGTKGRTLRVHGVDHHAVEVAPALADSVRAGLRLFADRASLAALQWALRHVEASDAASESPCVVLSD